MNWTAEKIYKILNLKNEENLSFEIKGISTDSRSIKAGDLFIALKGEKFNGEDFLEQVKNAGAAAALVHNARNIDFPQIEVPDTLRALQKLAGEYRDEIDAKVIAITGSNGKTTTKEITAKILSEEAKTFATKGNLNNDIGMPLSLLSIAEDDVFAVIEMGASHPDDISRLMPVVRPDISLITNISGAHLQGFGSLHAVMEAKTAIYKETNGIMVINNDLIQAQSWKEQFADRPAYTYGIEKEAQVKALELADYAIVWTLQIGREKAEIQWDLKGKHNVYNALAACAIAYACGLDVMQMACALEGFYLANSRLQEIKIERHTFYDDTYNANPASFRAGIDVIALAQNPLVIAGKMAELGEDSELLHKGVYEYAQKKGISNFWSLNAPEYGGENFNSMEELAQALLNTMKRIKNLTVLVKGSRSAKMERLFNELGMEKVRS